VTAEEAAIVEMRAQALARFTRRYHHDPESLRAMLGALRRIARVMSGGTCTEKTFPWELLVDDDLTEQVWAALTSDDANYARSTLVRDASALRVMLKYCHKAGLLTYDEYTAARSFECDKGGRPTGRAGRHLSGDDIRALLHAAAAGPHPETVRVRDTAILACLASSGARGTELLHLRLEDAFLQESRLWLSHTKSGRPRDAWLHPVAVQALERWVTMRPDDGPWVFNPCSWTGRPLTHRRFSERQLRRNVAGYAAAAGLAHVSVHDLRRFVVSGLLTHHDITLVASIVGHTKTETTAGYDRRPAAQALAAVQSLDLTRALAR
jgi:integrase